MQDSVRRQQQSMDAARGRMFDAAALGYVAYRALSAPIGAAVEFQSQLEGIRQKAEMTRTELADLGREAREIGLATSQGAGAITGALDTLLGSGAVTPEQALAVAEALGKAASAYSADPTDLANATSALIGNMGIAADEMERTFDIMSSGGKEGKFELKDMAAEFPGITAAAKALGIQGTAGVADLVAALEVAAGSAASGSEAANNMANFMQKVMAPDAIKKFGEAGIDIVDELNSAAASGVSPLERALDIVGQLTKGGKQELIGQYFADSEVQKFLRPLLQNMEEYRRIRQAAIDAEGVVERDYQEWLTTPGGAIARFEASIENLNLAVGNSLLPKLTEFINAVTPMVDGVSRFVDANDQLVAAILEMVAAIIGLRVAAAAGSFGASMLGLGAGAALPGGAAASSAAGGGGAAAAAGGLLGMGKNFLGTAFGKSVAAVVGFELAKAANSMGVGEGIGDPNKTWDHNVVHALDPALAKMIYEGYDPLPALGMTNRQGGIGGGYTGATQGQIDALKSEMANLDSEIAEWPEQALEDRRARLAEKLAGMEAELSAHADSMAAKMADVLARMRAAAAGGVTIPIRTSGPNLNSGSGRMVEAVGFSRGGQVNGLGTATSDSIPAWLSDGEYVVNAGAAGRHGALLDAINGGYVPPGAEHGPEVIFTRGARL